MLMPTVKALKIMLMKTIHHLGKCIQYKTMCVCGEPPNAVQLQLFIKNRYTDSQYGKEPENELGTWWGQHVNTNFLESFWNTAYKIFSFALSLNFLFYRIIRHPLGCQAFLTC